MPAIALTLCENCRRPLKIKRAGRKRQFCCSRCRSAARRERHFVSTGYPSGRVTQNASKKRIVSVSSEGENRDRGSPINILGGHRWPGQSRLDRRLIATIIEIEIGGTLIGAGKSSALGAGRPGNDNRPVRQKRAA
jgi:hypothetical protein